MRGMVYTVVLLVLVAQTRARIIDDLGEDCGSTICGYGAQCLIPGDCSCIAGFAYKRTVGQNNVQYCLEKCDKSNSCPFGTTCIKSNWGTYICDCYRDDIRTPLGECNSLTTTTTPSTADTLTTGAQARAQTSITESSGPSIGCTVSFVFNGILTAILFLLIIFLFRKRLCRKLLSKYTFRHGLDLTTKTDNPDRPMKNIEVTPPANQYSASPDRIIVTNDSADERISNYDNTPMYEDLQSAVDSNYINTCEPQSTKDYEGLRLGQASEQTDYEQLHQP